MIDPASLLAETRRELAGLPAVVTALISGLDAAAARTRPAPGEWAPVEIVCHLRDEETEDFGARLRALLEGARGFAPIDPERWAEERRYRDACLGDALREWRARRAASIDLLATVPPDRLGNALPMRGAGTLSGLDLLAAWVAHDRLHLQQLAGTMARLWADRWAPLRAGYAGPIPYPPAAAPPDP